MLPLHQFCVLRGYAAALRLLQTTVTNPDLSIRVVEISGIEPLALCLQDRCSTMLSYIPVLPRPRAIKDGVPRGSFGDQTKRLVPYFFGSRSPVRYVSAPTVSACPVACSGMSQCYRFESGRLPRRGATPFAVNSAAASSARYSRPVLPFPRLEHGALLFGGRLSGCQLPFGCHYTLCPGQGRRVVPHGRCDLPSVISRMHRACGV